MTNSNIRSFETRTLNVYRHSFFRKTLLFISLCLLLITVCAFRTANTPVVLTDADNGKTIAVATGSQVIIQLPSNAGSTGYTWNFTTSGNQVLTWQNAHYIAPKQPMPGAPGTVIFTYLAHNSGSVQLQFELRRSWETGVPPVQRFAVTIQVSSTKSA